MKVYFDLIYNPVYDFTTAQLASYRTLQSTCIDKLKFDNGDKVLCVGVGTGNEVIQILRRNSNVDIVGVDYSGTALRKAYRKARRSAKEIRVLTMNARHLEFAAGSFDKILCLHLMDFVEDHTEVTNEILRVLKIGGQFVITYPSEKEGAKLGGNILKDFFHQSIISKRYINGLLVFLVRMVAGSIYLPLVLRRRWCCSRHDLHAMFTRLAAVDFQIEEFPAYQDFIVWGSK